jgi:hypothetical protein
LRAPFLSHCQAPPGAHLLLGAEGEWKATLVPSTAAGSSAGGALALRAPAKGLLLLPCSLPLLSKAATTSALLMGEEEEAALPALMLAALPSLELPALDTLVPLLLLTAEELPLCSSASRGPLLLLLLLLALPSWA